MSKPAMINRQQIGEYYQEIDGHWVFEPDRTTPGYWNEYILLKILYDLRVLNAKWDLMTMSDPKISDIGES